MEDICYGFFAALSCPQHGCCRKAHDLADIAAPDAWVVFRSRNVCVAQHLVPHLQHVDRLYFLPNRGSLMRCQSAQAACSLVEQYCDYCGPVLLSHYIAEVVRRPSRNRISPTWTCSAPTRTAAAVGAGDISSGPGLPHAACDARADRGPPPQRSPRPSPGERPRDEAAAPVARPAAAAVAPEGRPSELAAARKAAVELLVGSFSFSTESDGSGVGHSGSDPSDEETAGSAAEEGHPPPCDLGAKGAKKPRDSISQRLWSKLDKKNCSHQVLHFLKENPALRSKFAAGWGALHQLWGIGPADFDAAVLLYLYTKSPEQQEQILLTFAAIGITSLQNLSAYLGCLIREHEATSQVCMNFLADVCDNSKCLYVHPMGTPGWNLLSEKWGYTYKDFDYPVLNYLAKKPFDQQEAILANYAALSLGDVKNLSAFLSSVIHKMEKNKPLKPVMPVQDLGHGGSPYFVFRGHGPHHSTRPIATIGSMISSPPKSPPSFRAMAGLSPTPALPFH
eukprot:EG_transcript_2613